MDESKCCIPFKGGDEELDKYRPLIIDAKDYALSHGLISRSKENPASAESVTYVPFLLVPSPFPREHFEEAKAIQKDFNRLMDRVAHDPEFLHECLKSTIESGKDDYTKELWRIYEEAKKDGFKQKVTLAINRSDYMLHTMPDGPLLLKQIEFNTMASSFGALCQKLYHVHKYILEEKGLDDKMNQVPHNDAEDALRDALVLAWEKYGEEHGHENAVILFLVYEIERNRYDQKWIEYAITKKNKKIKVIRVSLEAIQEMLEPEEGETESQKEEKRKKILTEAGKLIIKEKEVAVVYQRSCYTPRDFKCPGDWEARLLIEKSVAIKCPSLGYHLAGTKKVQQMLAKPGNVERFLTQKCVVKDAAERIRKTFAEQFTLDKGEEGDANVAKANAEPTKYVLKPQREGGGNNIFKEEDIKKTLSEDGREAYILMEKLNPPSFMSYVVRSGVELKGQKMVSELGIFGTFVSREGEELLNEQRGHILRTKAAGTDEGGVASGYAAIDSPYLV